MPQTLCQIPDTQLGAVGQAQPPQPCGPTGQEGLEARKPLGLRPDGWRPPRGPADSGGPYHYFWILSHVLISRRVQHHPAGVCVQAMDVENSVSDVSSRPLQDLPKTEPEEEKVGVTEHV